MFSDVALKVPGLQQLFVSSFLLPPNKSAVKGGEKTTTTTNFCEKQNLYPQMLNSVFKQESISHNPVVFVYSEYLCDFPAFKLQERLVGYLGKLRTVEGHVLCCGVMSCVEVTQ